MQYLGRVLELRTVECIQEQYYALVRLTIGEEKVEFKWRLDAVTGENLTELVESSPNHKFRLSFECYMKPQGNGYYSSISKLSGEKSETFFFICSENYAKNISWINELNSIKEIGSVKSTASKSKTVKTKRTKSLPRNIFKENFKVVVATAVTIAILLGFSLSMLNGNTANAVPQSELNASIISSPVKKTDEIEVKQVDKASVSAKESKQAAKQASVPLIPEKKNEALKSSSLSTTPMIEVESGKTYSLPEGYVAITFDDGPSVYTKQIVDILTQYKVGGTFFFIGNKVQNNPEGVKYAQDKGFSVANHSMTHSDLTKQSTSQQKQELDQTNELLTGIINQPVNLFRPPYGAINDQIVNLASQQNVKTIMWNKDPLDWKKRDTNAIINYTLATNGSGSIYVFHEIEATAKALPIIIEHFQSQGLKIVSLR